MITDDLVYELRRRVSQLEVRLTSLDQGCGDLEHHQKRNTRRIEIIEEDKTRFKVTPFYPPCPSCKRAMTLKTNNTTSNKFWGCQSWPTCWGTRDYPDASKDRGRSLDAIDNRSGYDSDHGHHPAGTVWECKRIR